MAAIWGPQGKLRGGGVGSSGAPGVLGSFSGNGAEKLESWGRGRDFSLPYPGSGITRGCMGGPLSTHYGHSPMRSPGCRFATDPVMQERQQPTPSRHSRGWPVPQQPTRSGQIEDLVCDDRFTIRMDTLSWPDISQENQPLGFAAFQTRNNPEGDAGQPKHPIQQVIPEIVGFE